MSFKRREIDDNDDLGKSIERKMLTPTASPESINYHTRTSSSSVFVVPSMEKFVKGKLRNRKNEINWKMQSQLGR